MSIKINTIEELGSRPSGIIYLRFPECIQNTLLQIRKELEAQYGATHIPCPYSENDSDGKGFHITLSSHISSITAQQKKAIDNIINTQIQQLLLSFKGRMLGHLLLLSSKKKIHGKLYPSILLQIMSQDMAYKKTNTELSKACNGFPSQYATPHITLLNIPKGNSIKHQSSFSEPIQQLLHKFFSQLNTLKEIDLISKYTLK